MKIEIECRLLEVDVEGLIKKLKANNATLKGDFLQMRYCYDFNPVKQNSWIRLRTNGVETTLTIKEIENARIDGTKESEVVVSDFKTTDEILNKMGYYARSKQENRRIRYVLNDVEIDIDFWPKIPPYVEFEAKNEEQIKRLFDLLDLDYSDTTTLDVESIYKHYNIFDINHLTLEESIKNFKYDI